MDKLDREAAQTKDRARFLGEDLRVVQQIVLFELQLDHGRRQRRRINWDIEFLEHIRHSADVVLVAVGQDDAADAAGVGFEIADIRQNNVDTVHILVGETHAAIDHDNVAAKFIGSHILADLAETAKRDNF